MGCRRWATVLACVLLLALFVGIESAATKSKNHKKKHKQKPAKDEKQLDSTTTEDQLVLGSLPGSDNIPQLPTNNKNIPHDYIPCAYEGDTCSCNGYVILGDPSLNGWSEAVKSTGSVPCVESEFPSHVSKYRARQCWCKDESLAVKDDLFNGTLLLPSAIFVTVEPGMLWWASDEQPLFDSMQTWDVLAVDTTRRRIDISYNQGKNMNTPALARQRNALAAVNGGFHAYGTEIGSITELRVDGVDVVTEDRVTEWQLTDEDVEGVLGITTSGQVRIVTTLDDDAWEDEPTFLHSGPLLLLDGVRQPLNNDQWNHVRNPRTAVCTVNDNVALLVTVDGRHTTAAGMTLGELQRFLQALGCRAAINLDGGGSTSMYIKSEEGAFENGVVNQPRDKPPPGVKGVHEFLTLREVSNAIVVL